MSRLTDFKLRHYPDFQCWEWSGARNQQGYGRYNAIAAHRLAYELVNGPIPEGLMLRHKCDNPPCCNPKHLIPGTAKDNASDAIDRDRFTRGAKNGRAKLTEVQALDILRNPDKMRATDLAEKHGVSIATISLVRSGQRWGHLAR